MEFAHYFHRFGGRFAVSPKLLFIPRRLGSIFAGEGNAIYRRTVAGVWLVVSALLAHAAYQAAQNESLTRWQRENAPHQRVWSSALDPNGFSELREPERIQKIVRTLPSATDDRANAWYSADGNWVAIYSQDSVQVFGKIRGEYFSSRIEEEEPRKSKKKGRKKMIRVKRLQSPWPPPPNTEAWQLAGVGWFGLDETLQWLEKTRAQELPLKRSAETKNRPKNAQPRDSRSIQY